MNYKTCNDCALDRYCGIDSEACESFKDRRLYPAHDVMRRTSVKYNIGDEVWIAECFCDEWYPTRYKATINKVVKTLDKNGVNVSYWVSYHNTIGCLMVEHHAENRCFPSYEDCLMWCKAQNGEK